MYSSSYLRIRAADTEKSVSDFNMFSKHIYFEMFTNNVTA